MSPRIKLTVAVTLIASAIAGAWLVLFRRQVLVHMPAEARGPSLSELSQDFNTQFSEYQAQLDRIRDGEPEAPPASVDADVAPEDMRTPQTP
ncbi:MAG: hypothetical protein Q7S96_03220 [bacterium]|nr:hypothetical protein [bacterium]